jgi:hypothetical protein
MKSYTKTTSAVAMVVAGFALLAATDAAFARINTGTRPISTNTSKLFGSNTGAGGKGVGGEANTNIGGSAGTITPPPPRRHHPRG